LSKKLLQSFQTLGVTCLVTRCHNLSALNGNQDYYDNLKPHAVYSRKIHVYVFTYRATYWALTTRLHIGP